MKKECIRPACEVVFETTDKRKSYCSRSCAAIVNNARYPKRLKSGNTHCAQCSNKLKSHQTKFCSYDCSAKHRCRQYIEDWLAGRVSGSQVNGKISSYVRNYLLECAGWRCSSPTCAVPGGWSVPNPVTGKPILTLDHIDGNWKNNSVDNLIVLCYSCHTLTPTFNGLNIGNGAGIRGSNNRLYKNAPLG